MIMMVHDHGGWRTSGWQPLSSRANSASFNNPEISVPYRYNV